MSHASPAPVALAALVGALAGMHAAIWGMYKDAIHEGFSRGRFARSVVVGALCAVIVQGALPLPLPGAGALVVLFGLAYAAERGLVEVWKTFVREEDQSKYFIPMQFSVRGVPVRSRALRLAAGLAYASMVGLCLLAIAQFDRPGAPPPTAARVAALGLVVGGIIAAGGAWKDAPKEGFDVLKFFRSPAMTAAFAVLLARLTDSHFEATVAAIGFERAAAETYKTFFFPSRPRGKFAGKPVLFPEMLERRRRFVPAYVLIWVAVAVSGALALAGAR